MYKLLSAIINTLELIVIAKNANCTPKLKVEQREAQKPALYGKEEKLRLPFRTERNTPPLFARLSAVGGSP